MNWDTRYSKSTPPDLAQIGCFIQSPLWDSLLCHLEQSYGVTPAVTHSSCSGAPGWNVKYKKGSRALCTLYPQEGFFTCLVSIGAKETMEAELLLAGCTDYVRKLYQDCRVWNGGRWLMIEVTSPEILEDVKALIGTRMHARRAERTNVTLGLAVKQPARPQTPRPARACAWRGL